MEANSDAAEFGAIVDAFVGRTYEATLATNSIKLRFDPRDHRHEYLWIDPPWVLYHESDVVMRSSEYSDAGFRSWAEVFAPARSGRLERWLVTNDSTVFGFDRGYRLVLPAQEPESDPDSSCNHWFAVGPAA